MQISQISQRRFLAFASAAVVVGCVCVSAIPSGFTDGSSAADDTRYDADSADNYTSASSSDDFAQSTPAAKVPEVHIPHWKTRDNNTHDVQSTFDDSERPMPADAVPDLHIPSIKIREKDMHEVQSTLLGGVTNIQNSLIGFLTGIFDSVKKVIETSSGKVVNILNESVNRTSAVNADYLATGKEIVDTFSQSFKNSSKLTKNLVGAFSPGGAHVERATGASTGSSARKAHAALDDSDAV